MLTNFALPDICFLILCLILGFLGYLWLKTKHPTLPRQTLLLFAIIHTGFALLYWYFSLSVMPADASNYYQNTFRSPEPWLFHLKLGTSFIYFLLYPLIHYFGLSYLSCFLIFNTFGIIGISIIFVTTRSYLTTPRVKRIYAMTLFLPGMSYWTSAIGKDSLILLGIGLTFYALPLLKSRWPALLAGFFISLYTRPHICAILFLAFIGFILLKRHRTLNTLLLKAILFSICLGIAISSYGMILKYIKLPSDISLPVVQDYVDTRLSYNQGGSYIELQNSSAPAKMFAYLFRPLFFDAKNALMVIGSIENVALLTAFGLLLWKPKRLTKVWTIPHPYYRMHVLYAVMGLLIFAIMTANLGIAMRQKYMLLPSMLSALVLILDADLQRRRKSPSLPSQLS
jgi:hypothetical protein